MWWKEMCERARERCVGEGDVWEGDAVRDGDMLLQEGNPQDTGMRQHVPLHPYSSLMPALANIPPAHGTCLPLSTCHLPTPTTTPIRIPPPTGHPGSPRASCPCPHAALRTSCRHGCVPTNNQPTTPAHPCDSIPTPQPPTDASQPISTHPPLRPILCGPHLHHWVPH